MRLTYRDNTVPHTNVKGELWEAYSDANYNEVINKLAAYEDTGLVPEEIKLSMDGLDEYRKVEAEGRLVILPCKVGDAIYATVYDDDYEIAQIYNGRVYALSVNERTYWLSVRYENGLSMHYTWNDIGKTIFLTREEAEAALGGEQDDV